jgi:hypothetical protein
MPNTVHEIVPFGGGSIMVWGGMTDNKRPQGPYCYSQWWTMVDSKVHGRDPRTLSDPKSKCCCSKFYFNAR